MGDNGLSSSSSESKITNLFFRGDVNSFRGEYCSFHALTTSGAQNASMLGRCGVGGILFVVLEGEMSLGFEGLGGGDGVRGRD